MDTTASGADTSTSGVGASSTRSVGAWGATAGAGTSGTKVSFREAAASTGVLCCRRASETSADGTCGTSASGASVPGVARGLSADSGKAAEPSAGAVACGAAVASTAGALPGMPASPACPAWGCSGATPCGCSASGTCVAPAGSPPSADSPACSAAASSVAANSAAAAWAAAASSFSFFLRRKKPNMSCVLYESAAVWVAAILEPVRLRQPAGYRHPGTKRAQGAEPVN